MNSIYVSSIAFTLITYPIMIDRIGLSEWGGIVLIISLASLVTMIVEFGLNLTGMEWCIKKTFDNHKDILFNVFFIKLLFWLAIISIYFSYVVFFGFNTNQFIGFIFIPLAEVFQTSWYLQIRKELNKYVVVFLTPKIIGAILIFFFAYEPYPVEIYLTLYVLSTLIPNAIVFINVLMNDGNSHVELKYSLLKNLISDAWPIMISKFIGMLKDRASIFFIYTYTSQYDVGVFDVGNKIYQLIINPVYMFVTLIFPDLKSDQNERRLVVKRSFHIILLVSFLACASIYGISTFFVNEFRTICQVTSILILSIPFLYLSSLVSNIYMLGVNPKYITYTSIFSLLVMLIPSVILGEKGLLTSKTMSVTFLISCISEAVIRYLMSKDRFNK